MGALGPMPRPSSSPYALPLFGPPTATSSASPFSESRLASSSDCAPPCGFVQPAPQPLRETVIALSGSAAAVSPRGQTSATMAGATTTATRTTRAWRRPVRQRREPDGGSEPSCTGVLLGGERGPAGVPD